MPPPSQLPSLAVGLVALALALAGCGGDTDREETAAQTAPAAPQRWSGEEARAADLRSRALEPEAGVPASAAEPDSPPPAASPARRAARRSAARGQLTIHLRRATALRSRPGGPVVARLGARTEFDSPTVLPVVRRSGGWLAVISSALPNGRVGWISATATMRAHRSRYRVEASLGRREVLVRRDGRVVSRFPVAIGAPGTPTPTGRFAVTDKLLTGSASSPYGCCILALSGHQTRTPQGWGGGDRLAIHATNLPETIGTAASLGCLRAPAGAARRLVQTVPLGTIVTIRA